MPNVAPALRAARRGLSARRVLPRLRRCQRHPRLEPQEPVLQRQVTQFEREQEPEHERCDESPLRLTSLHIQSGGLLHPDAWERPCDIIADVPEVDSSRKPLECMMGHVKTAVGIVAQYPPAVDPKLRSNQVALSGGVKSPPSRGDGVEIVPLSPPASPHPDVEVVALSPACSPRLVDSSPEMDYGFADWQLDLLNFPRGGISSMALPEHTDVAWVDAIRRIGDLQAQVDFWKARASELADLASDAKHVEQQRALARQRARRRAQTLREQVEYWRQKAINQPTGGDRR